MTVRNVALTGAAIGTAAVMAAPTDITWMHMLLPIESALLAVAIEWARRMMSRPAPDAVSRLVERVEKLEEVLESIDARLAEMKRPG
jgi:hypothetical protein